MIKHSFKSHFERLTVRCMFILVNFLDPFSEFWILESQITAYPCISGSGTKTLLAVTVGKHFGMRN